MFKLNILCDVIRDVVDKHVYIWRICVIEQLDNFGNDWLQLSQQRVDILNNVLVNVSGTVDML